MLFPVNSKVLTILLKFSGLDEKSTKPVPHLLTGKTYLIAVFLHASSFFFAPLLDSPSGQPPR